MVHYKLCIQNFSILLSPFSNYLIVKVVALNIFVSYLYSFFFLQHCPPDSYRSFNCCDRNTCRFFSLLKAKAKNKGKLILIASKRNREKEHSSNTKNYTKILWSITLQGSIENSLILLSHLRCPNIILFDYTYLFNK